MYVSGSAKELRNGTTTYMSLCILLDGLSGNTFCTVIAVCPGEVYTGGDEEASEEVHGRCGTRSRSGCKSCNRRLDRWRLDTSRQTHLGLPRTPRCQP